MKKTIFAALLLTALSTASAQTLSGAIPETKLSISQYRTFLARKDVYIFPAHGINFTSSDFYLIKGVRQEGGCRFSQTLEPDFNKQHDGEEYGAVDMAVDEASCEKVSQKGFYIEPQSSLVNPGKEIAHLNKGAVNIPLKNDGLISTNQYSTEAATASPTDPYTDPAMPISTIVTSDVKTAPLYSPLCPAKPYPSDKYKPGYLTGGVYTQWDDGNNPIFRGNNICLTTNWVQTELQFAPNACEKALNEGGYLELYYVNRYFWRTFTGWTPELGPENRYRVDGYCNAYRANQFSPWVVTSSKYQSNIWQKFTNPGIKGIMLGGAGFPTCADAVHTAYDPSSVILNDAGQVSVQVNTYWSGQRTFCGEWLRSFSKVFRS